MLSTLNSNQEPVVWLDFKTTTLDDVYDNGMSDGRIVNRYLLETTNKNLFIVSEIDGYWFEIEKSLLLQKYPESVLTKVSQGSWMDRDEVMLPFSREILVSLEFYLHTDTWILTEKLRSGNDFYQAGVVLDYLMIHFNENIDYYEDIKNPYMETNDVLPDNELVEDDFQLWEEYDEYY